MTAVAAKRRADKARRAAELAAAGPDDARHGTPAGWVHAGCTCDKCRIAHRVYNRDHDRRRAVKADRTRIAAAAADEVARQFAAALDVALAKVASVEAAIADDAERAWIAGVYAPLRERAARLQTDEGRAELAQQLMKVERTERRAQSKTEIQQ